MIPNYNITPERFARARADIARRRALLDAELAGLEADEETAAAIAARYPEPAAAKKAKRPNTGRPYKPKENARIVAAERGTLEALAEALGRDYPGVLKQHEVLFKHRKPEKTDTPAPEPARAHRLRYNTGPGTPFQEPQDSRAPETDKGEETKALVGSSEREALTGQRAAGDVGNPPPGPLSPTHPDLIKEPDPSEQLGSENPAIVEPTAAPTTSPPADARPPVRIEKGGYVPNSEGSPAHPPKASGVPSASTAAPDTDPAALFDSHHSGSPHELAEAARELAAADGRRARLPPAKPGISVTGRLMDNGPTDQRVYGSGWSRSE